MAERGLPEKQPASRKDMPVKKCAARRFCGSPKEPRMMPMKLSEKDRQMAFAALVLVAIAAAAYVLFFIPPSDKPSDLEGFATTVMAASNAAIFMDARGASIEQSRIIYQCGTDIAAGSLFGSRKLQIIGCESDEGCISASSDSNSSSKLTYFQAKKALATKPYIEIAAGIPQTLFFENHAEIRIDASYNGTCKLG